MCLPPIGTVQICYEFFLCFLDHPIFFLVFDGAMVSYMWVKVYDIIPFFIYRDQGQDFFQMINCRKRVQVCHISTFYILWNHNLDMTAIFFNNLINFSSNPLQMLHEIMIGHALNVGILTSLSELSVTCGNATLLSLDLRFLLIYLYIKI